jgi:hypothetical protein
MPNGDPGTAAVDLTGSSLLLRESRVLGPLRRFADRAGLRKAWMDGSPPRPCDWSRLRLFPPAGRYAKAAAPAAAGSSVLPVA